MKYELLNNDTIEYKGHVLKRIKRLDDGTLGGYIEFDTNLSQKGVCWVHDSAKVWGDAHVEDDAQIQDSACIFDRATVSGSAVIKDNAQVYGRAEVSGAARVQDDSHVYGWSKVYDNAIIKGRSQVGGDAKIFGEARILNARIVGRAEISADATVEDLWIESSGRIS